MESAPVLLPSPQKSPFRTAYAREMMHEASSEEEPYSYDPSPDEAVFDDDRLDNDDSQNTSSPQTSDYDDDDDVLSTIPPDPDSRAPSTIYTPHKRRTPFRHPSSVHNIQLETTPPHLISPSRRHYQQLSSPSRNSTPRSHYSTQSRSHSTRSSPSKKPKPKKEHPLILLHLTLLPLSLPYSQSLLETVLPPKKLADCKLLREKLGADVIQERGVLIPHPKDDYDLLEERLLEALELEQGALSRDGHFLLPEERRSMSRAGSRSLARTRFGSEDIPEEDENAEDDKEDRNDDDDAHTEVADPPLCDDCGRHIRTINSERRWDIRVYAANGLMREGAWGAAWREMERVDVEIKPYFHEELKRELEARWEEAKLLVSTSANENASPAPTEEVIHQSIEVEEEATATQVLLNASLPSPSPAPEETRMRLSTERLKEIYGEQADAKIESMMEDRGEYYGHPGGKHDGRLTNDIQLSTLLKNYVRVLLRDQRNIAIFALSALVLFMAMQTMVLRPTASGQMSPITTPIAAASPAVDTFSAKKQHQTTSSTAQLPETTQVAPLDTENVEPEELTFEALDTPETDGIIDLLSMAVDGDIDGEVDS